MKGARAGWLFGLVLLAGAIDAAAQVQVPPRDVTRTAQAGTAAITGRILGADGRPLRRAQIRASSPSLSESKTASSNARGEYALRGLPAGRYTITVTRSGYLTQQYGQRRANEPAKPLQLDEAATVDRVDFTLARAGVIGGIVTDETGDAVAGVSVWAMQFQHFQGRRRLVPVGDGARTDDTGQYRVLALPPGDYVVMAILRETWVTRDKEPQLFGYAPTYFPGTANAPDAQPVKVAVGQEVTAIDIGLVPGRAVTISGTIARADGTPIGGADISLTQEITGPLGGSYSSVADTIAAPDGTWTLRKISPGEYRLSGSATDPQHGNETTTTVITVQGADSDGVSLVAGAVATVSGQVVTDTGEPLPSAPTVLRVLAQTIGIDIRQTLVPNDDPSGVVGRDGRFTVKKVTGPAVFTLWGTPAGWAVKNIMVGGRDASVTPVEIRAGQKVDGASVVLTRSFPALAGRITGEAGEPAEGVALLFPADRSRWIELLRTTRTERPDQSGRFTFDAVRPGAYLAIAVDAMEAWQANDPTFLEALQSRATKLTVSDAPGDPITLVVQKVDRDQ